MSPDADTRRFRPAMQWELRSDGSRVLYDQNEPECLYGSWGTLEERRWEAYRGAFPGGTTSRRTETHSLFEGAVTLTEYRDPFDDGVRFVLERIRVSGPGRPPPASAGGRHGPARAQRTWSRSYRPAPVSSRSARVSSACDANGAPRAGVSPAGAFNAGRPSVISGWWAR